ncbi:MAG: glycosyltransferase family 2 protein [Candidatus Nealsonbacteria bacterium]|nr:glycosyltransferase family 2 protein [Candidatus Nealsonbacteria bacterium]
MRPEVSIIVLSYNHWNATVAALNSLAMTQQVAFETIVVDNGSDSLVRNLLKKCQRTDLARGLGLRCIFNEENRGISRGRNQGANAAHGAYLLFLDNDVEIVDPAWLAALVAPLRARQDSIGVTGSVLLHATPERDVQFAGGTVSRQGHVRFKTEFPRENAFSTQWFPTMFCLGASLCTSRAVWEITGGFDPAYHPMDYEDIDFCLTAAQSKRRSVVVRESVLLHHAHTTTYSRTFDRMRVYLRSGRYFLRKWGGYLSHLEAESPDKEAMHDV